MEGYGIELKRPVAVWNKPLKLECKNFFKALTKTLATGAVKNWALAPQNLVEGVEVAKTDFGAIYPINSNLIRKQN